MAKSLNFQTKTKEYLNVTLPDGKKLLLSTPTKKVFDALTALQSDLENIKDNDIDIIGGLYESCAVIMCRNKTGAVITREYLEEIFDISDIITFFYSYIDFVHEIANSKN